MPLRSLCRATPWMLIGVLTLGCLPAIRVIRGIRFTIAGPPDDPNIIVANEVVCVLYAICVAALIAPTMPEIDLRRPRAKILAVARLVIAGSCVLIVSGFAARQLNLAYFAEAGTTSVAPESELLINNSMLVFGIATVAITLLGKLRGIPLALLSWVIGIAPLVFFHDINLWPFAALRGDGPWCSWPHIAVTLLVLMIALAIQFRTAGVGSWALAAERSEQR